MARILDNLVVWLGLMMQISHLHGMALHTSRQPRLTVLDSNPDYYYYRNVGGQPGTYLFGYDVVDPRSGTSQFRSEERLANGTVIGSYGFVDSFGKSHSYNYIADARGYRVSNIPLYRPTEKPARFEVIPTVEPEITWTRPKRPLKNKFVKGKIKNILSGVETFF